MGIRVLRNKNQFQKAKEFPVPLSEIPANQYFVEKLDFFIRKKLHFKSAKSILKRKPFDEKLLVGVKRTHLHQTMDEIYHEYFADICGIRPKTIGRIINRFSASELSKFNSFINTEFKLNSRYLTQDWICYIDLGTLIGYPKLSARTFKDNPTHWLVSGVEFPNINVSEIESKIAILLGQPFISEFPTYYNWVNMRWTWQNNGSSKHTNMVINGDKVKTKFASALSLTIKQLLDISSLKKILAEGLRFFVKPDEKGTKGRYVCNAPLGLYLVQKYLIDKLLAYCKGLDARFGQYQQPMAKVQNIMDMLKRGIGVIPLDFDAFDYHIAPELWVAFFNVLKQWLPDDVELIEIWRVCLNNINVYDVDGKLLGKWTHGMPSGFYATAFCDTLFNLVATSFLDQSKYRSVIGQGDDSCIATRLEEPNLNSMSETLENTTGMKANKTKNWFNPNETEILKMIVTKDEVFQYPARAYSSLIWKYPNFENNDPVAKLQELSSTWKEYVDRVLPFISGTRALIKRMYADITNFCSIKFQWTKNMTHTWLHTPNIFGGFGLTPNIMTVTFKPRYEHSVTKIKGLIKEAKTYPMIVNYFKFWKINTIVKHARFASVIAGQSLVEYTHTLWPTFSQWLEYVKATSAKFYIGIKHVPPPATDILPFRIFGMSDVAVGQLYGYVNKWLTNRDQMLSLRTLASIQLSIRSSSLLIK